MKYSYKNDLIKFLTDRGIKITGKETIKELEILVDKIDAAEHYERLDNLPDNENNTR